LLAARALASAGVQITPLFTGSHEAAVAALRNGTAAASATYADPTRPGLRALAPTGEVMNEPVFFRRDVPEAIRGRLAQALTDLAESAEGTAVLADFGGVSGFAPVTDEAYTPVRDLLAATQHDLESLVSGGKAFVDRNRLVLGGVGL
jgi:ABC-type phosphate/phosphonate transport system substrate-binding protein